MPPNASASVPVLARGSDGFPPGTIQGGATHGAVIGRADRADGTHRWEERYEELEKYKHKYGDCRVPSTFDALGTWLDQQRRTFRRKTLLDDQVERLNEVGLVWGMDYAERWEGKYSATPTHEYGLGVVWCDLPPVDLLPCAS